jgi:hypothetical protein
MLRPLQLITGLILLIVMEIVRAYFAVTLAGQSHAAGMAHFLHDNIFYFRTIGWLIILFPVVFYLWLGTRSTKVLTLLGLALYLFVFYVANTRYTTPAATNPTEVASNP